MDKSKLLISLVVVVGGGAAAYFYFRSQCQANPSGTVCGWLGMTAQPSTPAATSSTPAGTVTAPAHAATTDAAYAQAIAAMKAAAASNSQNFGAWSYYFQNAPTFAGAPTGFGQTGGISPNLYAAIVTLGGGDDTKLISADQFVGYYKQAMANAGLSGFEIPVWLVHRGGYA
jgi:hypothetical protein